MVFTLRASHATRMYLTGFTLTNVGVGGFTLAVGLAFYQESGSAATFGLLVAIEYAVGLVGQLTGGSTLDRFSTLKVALLTNSVRCVAVLAGGLSVVLTANQMPLMIAFLISAFIRPQYRSASFVLAREVTPASDLTRINALRSGFLPTAKLCGLATVALLAAFIPVGWILCVLTLFFFAGTVAYASLAGLPRGQFTGAERDSAHRPTSLTQSWRQLGTVLRSAPGLRVQLFLYGMPATVAALAAVLVAPVNHAVDGGSFGIAILDGGAAIGALCSVSISRRLNAHGYLVGVACALTVVSLLNLAASGNIYSAGISFWLLGLATTLAATTMDTIMQRRASPAILGRLFITQEFVISVTAIVLLPVSGAFATERGIGFTSFVYAAIAGCYLIVFLVSRLILGERMFAEKVELTATQPVPSQPLAAELGNLETS